MSTLLSGFSIKRVALFLGAALLFLGFVGLGCWQLSRLHWKLNLIERVESRAYAVPIDPPAKTQWADVNAQNTEYLSVVLRGHFEPKYNTYVQASTRLGFGFWLMTPMRLPSGVWVWVNQGFVSEIPSQADVLSEGHSAAQLSEVFGLLRVSEESGAFLRQNVPAEGRWYSRDVQALSGFHRMKDVAPYFVDAFTEPRPVMGQEPVSLRRSAVSERSDDTGESLAHRVKVVKPVPGLTVLSFRNNHLSYALTWFSLAAMVAALSFWLWRRRVDVEF
jgi:surfeit locus 1 family protein